MYIYFPFFSLVMLKLINFPSFQFSDLSSPSALTSLPSPCRTLFSQVPVNTSPLPNVYFPAPCFIPSTQLPSYLQTMKQTKPSKRLYIMNRYIYNHVITCCIVTYTPSSSLQEYFPFPSRTPFFQLPLQMSPFGYVYFPRPCFLSFS